MMMCRALGVPVVLHLHAAQLHHFYRAMPALLRAATRWVFSLPDSVVVLGPSARRFVTEELRVPAAPRQHRHQRRARTHASRAARHSRAACSECSSWESVRAQGCPDLLQALARPGFGRAGLEVDHGRRRRRAGLPGQGPLARCRRIRAVRGLVRPAAGGRAAGASDLLVLPSYDEVLAPRHPRGAGQRGRRACARRSGRSPSRADRWRQRLFREAGRRRGIWPPACRTCCSSPPCSKLWATTAASCTNGSFHCCRSLPSSRGSISAVFGIAALPRELRPAAPGDDAVIVDANTVENGACLRTDVCVVGGGRGRHFAGLALSGQGLNVLLLESGHDGRACADPGPV